MRNTENGVRPSGSRGPNWALPIPKAPEQDENASYIGNWLKVLKGNKHAIFSAQKAADFLHRPPEREPDFASVARNNYDPSQASPTFTNG
jgi:antirestriction protein ArdC